MSKGFKATLFAGAITLSAFAPVYAAAPVISGLPDVRIGDLEDSTESTDNNLFIFTDAFQFSDYVTDAETTDAASLTWSFAEFGGGLGASEYTINGVGPSSNGDTEIADDAANGNAKALISGNKINTSAGASFRDIILSPAAGSTPFADPSAGDVTLASTGKVVRYYVADGEGNVSSADAIVRTVDDSTDSITATDGYDQQTSISNLSNWITSGIPSEGTVTSISGGGDLNVTVSPTQAKTRIVGYKNNNLMPYDAVGPTKFVHGKFYVYTSNSIADAIALNVNRVPGFRIRLNNEEAVDAANHYEYAQTGYSNNDVENGYESANSPDAETKAGIWIRPTDQSTIPSLYKIDFDPIDVPAAVGSRIGGVFESFAIPDPADGTLTLTEVVLGTYDAKQDADGDLVWSYNRATGLAGGVGGAKNIGTSGAFNAEGDFQAGRRQKLFAPSRGDIGPYATVTDQGANGLVADTDLVPQDVFGIGILNVESTNNADKLRIAASKFYRAKFYATSNLRTSPDSSQEIQGNMRFRFQTGMNTVSYLLELNGLAQVTDGSPLYSVKGDQIATQAMPGSENQNPDTTTSLAVTGEKGGWYSVLVSSPLDPDAIRKDYQEYDTIGGGGFFFFGLEPDHGAAGASAKDVKLGMDLIQGPNDVRLFPEPSALIHFAQQNRSNVRVSAIEVYEYPSISDGGYDFSGQ